MTGKCEEPTCILGYVYDPTQPRGKRNPPCPTCRPPHTEALLPALKTKTTLAVRNPTQTKPPATK